MSSKSADSTAGPNDAGQVLGEQGTPLLRTKLFIPQVRARQVDRPDLVEKVNHGLEKALVLVSAPAGFGKSTLLAEWAAQAKLPVAWLSLDAGDNDPRGFLAYLIAAFNTALADLERPVCMASQALLHSIFSAHSTCGLAGYVD